jgi:hypothetical protein
MPLAFSEKLTTKINIIKYYIILDPSPKKFLICCVLNEKDH